MLFDNYCAACAGSGRSPKLHRKSAELAGEIAPGARGFHHSSIARKDQVIFRADRPDDIVDMSPQKFRGYTSHAIEHIYGGLCFRLVVLLNGA